MASKAINSGVEKIANNNTLASLNAIEMAQKSWRDLRNKLDSILLSTNVVKGDEARKRCLALDTMVLDERISHIKTNWGSSYAERTLPLIHQLEVLEKQINKLKTD